MYVRPEHYRKIRAVLLFSALAISTNNYYNYYLLISRGLLN